MVVAIVLVLVFGLGVAGAALAAVAAEIVGVVLGLVVLARLGARPWTASRIQVFDRAAMRRTLAVNTDIMIRTIAISFAFAFFTSQGARAGDTTLAANAVLYNMFMIALDSHADVFSGQVWPEHPSLENFRVVVTEDFWYLWHFWRQFGNSFFVGLMTMFLTLLIGSLASFTVGRMRLRNGWLLTNAALMTYVIPASFLAIPFYRIMQIYGLTNHLWAVVAAITTFATPYAIFTAGFNSSGQPAITLPLHWSDDGLPIGVQLVAAFGREDLLLRVAAQLEQAQPWAERRPPLAAAATS